MFKSGRLTVAPVNTSRGLEEVIALQKQNEAIVNRLLISTERLENEDQARKRREQNVDAIHESAMRSYVASELQRMYSNVRPLNKRKFHDRQGNVFVEFDGLFAVKSRDTLWMLVTLECKQTVRTADFDDRLSQIAVFKEFVRGISTATEDQFDSVHPSFIEDCDILRRYASSNVQFINFLGGNFVSESDRTYGRQLGFHVIYNGGGSFSHELPTSET